MIFDEFEQFDIEIKKEEIKKKNEEERKKQLKENLHELIEFKDDTLLIKDIYKDIIKQEGGDYLIKYYFKVLSRKQGKLFNIFMNYYGYDDPRNRFFHTINYIYESFKKQFYEQLYIYDIKSNENFKYIETYKSKDYELLDIKRNYNIGI